MTASANSSGGELTVADGALLKRCEASMVLAIRHYYQLPYGLGRDRALREAADFASVVAALRELNQAPSL